jgi:hypothetical protein
MSATGGSNRRPRMFIIEAILHFDLSQRGSKARPSPINTTAPRPVVAWEQHQTRSSPAAIQSRICLDEIAFLGRMGMDRAGDGAPAVCNDLLGELLCVGFRLEATGGACDTPLVIVPRRYV